MVNIYSQGFWVDEIAALTLPKKLMKILNCPSITTIMKLDYQNWRNWNGMATIGWSAETKSDFWPYLIAFPYCPGFCCFWQTNWPGFSIHYDLLQLYMHRHRVSSAVDDLRQLCLQLCLHDYYSVSSIMSPWLLFSLCYANITSMSIVQHLVPSHFIFMRKLFGCNQM